MKDALMQKRRMRSLMKFVDPQNRDAEYYPSTMIEKEKLKSKYNNSQHYNMGYTYEVVKQHSHF